ncbi:MAG TPA: ribonuclease H-like domain-containing protein [Methanomassiliicoccales archaeon]|nr:ribonuclease H-like domain-containing protein [Methanomassiliicoccales archaeon]
MIRRTFVILPSIGNGTERSLWREGIRHWDDFIDTRSIKGMSQSRKGKLDEHLIEARGMLDQGHSHFFTNILVPCEQWRLFEEMESDITYLDIETDGLRHDSKVTVVGIHRGGVTETLVRGIDLDSDSLKKALERTKLLVTFNGRSFDVPLLDFNFPFAVPRVPHFDLRHGCARIGLKGGLKKVERDIGIGRPKEIDYVTGEEAAYLWKLWERKGNQNALNLLRKYNEEDTRNLEPLARYTYQRLRSRLEGAMMECQR